MQRARQLLIVLGGVALYLYQTRSGRLPVKIVPFAFQLPTEPLERSQEEPEAGFRNVGPNAE